jgi:hypothetical protein
MYEIAVLRLPRDIEITLKTSLNTRIRDALTDD